MINTKSLSGKFNSLNEFSHALASLGLSPSLPPNPGTLAFASEKVEYVMKEIEKTPLADAVRELVDLKKIKQIVELMCEGDQETKERLLDKLPGLINALSRFANAPAAKAPVVADASELDQV
jgi:hypothetical protein